MTSLSTARARGKNDFVVIADSFLHDPGLPFASVLDSESIARACVILSLATACVCGVDVAGTV